MVSHRYGWAGQPDTVDFSSLEISVSAVSVVRDRRRRAIQKTGGKNCASVSMTSAEPARTTAYSPDIGWRVVWQRMGMELSFKAIAIRLQIGVSTAFRLYKKYESTGDVVPKSKGERIHCRKLDNHHELYILALVHENPAIYLNEIRSKIEEATGVAVSGPTVCRVLHRNHFSRKRLVNVALQRSEEHRGTFMANVLQYPRDFLVWVDETGTDRRDQLRKFGYSIRGLPPVCKLFTRGTRLSAIAAISWYRAICWFYRLYQVF